MRRIKYVTLKQHCAKCDRIVTRKFNSTNAAILELGKGSVHCLFCKERIRTLPDLFSSLKAAYNDDQTNTSETAPPSTDQSPTINSPGLSQGETDKPL
jgi:hypothetical protein